LLTRKILNAIPLFLSITEEDISEMLKFLRSNKTFWTPETLTKFFNLLYPSNSKKPELTFQAETMKVSFNICMYGLFKEYPKTATLENICIVLEDLNFPKLSGKCQCAHYIMYKCI
jgi:hypothetical protein